MSNAAQTGGITAQQVIERIQQQVGVPWRQQTVDTIKAGSPSTRVTGIATTFMATFDVVRRAVSAGANVIITHEPTFYNHTDPVEPLAGDPVYAAKQAFIDRYQVVIFRFHDHWHARRPDGVRAGVVKALGWPEPAQGNTFVIPATTLGALARDLQQRMRAHALRVVGDPQTPVTRVAVGLGYGNPQLSQNVDVVVTGETQEAGGTWDNAAYALDAAATTKTKGLILLGHQPSEEPGMEECAAWLKTFVTEVPVTFIGAGEAFWPG